MEHQSYPKKYLAIARTSTEIGCVKCGSKILPYQEHFVDRDLHYHDGCEPQETPVLHEVSIEDKIDITKDGTS